MGGVAEHHQVDGIGSMDVEWISEREAKLALLSLDLVWLSVLNELVFQSLCLCVVGMII